ncbi:MAG: hypothetical protein ACK5PB_19575 [Pirellula sp.]|jgi:hypothetical protein
MDGTNYRTNYEIDCETDGGGGVQRKTTIVTMTAWESVGILSSSGGDSQNTNSAPLF